MSFEEKRSWVYAGVAIVIPALYAMVVFGQLPSTPIEDIDYVTPLFSAIGLAIVLTILGTILLAIAGGGRNHTPDERDKIIGRRSELVGYYVLSVGVVGALVLVCTNQPHFWIANAIYAAFIVSAIISSIVKLVAYRRGF